MAPKTEVYPLYNVGYSVQRVSLLHTQWSQTLLSKQSLDNHAQQLARIVRGDTGYDVLTDTFVDNSSNKSGALKDCHWNVLVREENWQPSIDDDEKGRSDYGIEDDVIGIHIQLKYDDLSYNALLLRDQNAFEANGDDEMRFPLLLTQMPNALRDVLFDYIANVFGAHISTMRMSSQVVMTIVEKFLTEIADSGTREPQRIIGDLHLALAFKIPIAPSLKTMDISIRSVDWSNMLDLQNEGNEGTGFLAALSNYFQTHLAMDINHPDVIISKVACGAFILSGDGRLKIFAPETDDTGVKGARTPCQMAVQNLVTSLIAKARRQS
ncbi:hypothetical protein MMC09_005069 [Bachmanniomyces sp. S44760]|nr:hypothetical protein [Bachmanniomyces sp. S44760]